MDHIKQRIAIAKASGWIMYGARKQMIGRPKGVTFNDAPCSDIPDYPNDLEAIQRAILSLQQHEITTVLLEVCELCKRDGNWPILATAAQRSEAFLRALKLWTP